MSDVEEREKECGGGEPNLSFTVDVRVVAEE